MDFEDEQYLKQRLDELQRDVSKKQKFEPAVAALVSLLRDRYSNASQPLRKSYYTVISRVATVLKTRYTSPGFWAAGLALFRLALTLVSDPAEKNQLLNYISEAEKVVRQEDEPPNLSPPNQGFLFEGHLTVDREPPQPQWLVQSNFMASAATLLAAESSRSGRPEPETGDNNDDSESAANLLQSLIDNLDSVLPPGILDDVRGAPRVPPASKKVVANLPVITITEEKLEKLGTDCCICKEILVVNDKMQELPCKHTFHPPCLKPWLDEHNSCPICRHELETDDHAYESWKEREREAEEDRKGAANAVRGGEYMYV
ncbi:putative aminoacyltransferase, E1 ubiquitin-activating enzyme [Rosa chinensis]|uniref:RING-type E3 ubiquitin transferase n=1 Tax=Rosa chinensis TaxID=74649 RepID=A0A2P6PZP7_ROSCH|nr:E3 ubiquitin-protein ligase AIP2 [Rosa chinensis]PRQ27382.1 putative aminoacyltransferase, E1 ubiquitin-activating enzyme [Rosa chinensis]